MRSFNVGKCASFTYDADQASALATAGSVNAADYEAYGYDAAGNRTSLRKRDGSTFAYQYDNLNRMTRKTVPERAGLATMHTRDVFYGYDLRNLQLFARFDSTSGEGVTSAYDGFGRLSSSAVNMGGTTRTLAYQYDPNANRTRITHPDTIYFSTDYDGLNRLLRIREPDNDQIAVMAYDAPGRAASLAFLGGSGTSYGYDGVSRLSSLAHALDGTSHDSTWTYTRNPASQLASIVRTNDSYAWTGHYGVDRNYTTNGLNRYTAAGSASFLYDLNGNLTSDGARTYSYDVENRLVGATGGVTLAYDPLGRIFQYGAGGTTISFLYDGDALVAEYNGPTLLRRYVHGAGADVPLVWYEGASIRRHLHADHQGSIIAIGQAYAVPYAVNRYDEYGVPAATNLGRFQYTGQIWLPDLGMYHYKARVYSPTLGRFMQTDPIGYEDQFNLYAYVGNDPMNRRDPDGRCQTRDSAKECVVTNRAGAAGVGATNGLQTQVRQVDHAVRNLEPKERVKVDTGGGNHQVMSGAQVARAWARTDWVVDDNGGNNFANGLGAQIDRGVFTGRPSYLEGFRNRAHQLGRNEDQATRSVVLHDFGHGTRIGREISRLYPGAPGQYNIDGERATSRLGRAIGGAIGETFECQTFITGC